MRKPATEYDTHQSVEQGESRSNSKFDVLLYESPSLGVQVVEFRKIHLKIMRGVSWRWLKLRVQLQSGFHKIGVKFEPKLRVISEVCETPYLYLTVVDVH